MTFLPREIRYPEAEGGLMIPWRFDSSRAVEHSKEQI
jgi:hypothetical protein